MSVITHEPSVTTVDVPSVSDEEAHRREVLLLAAELIELHGWIGDSDGMKVEGPYCILGAVACASRSRTYMDLDNHLRFRMGDPAELIGVPKWEIATRWNDRLKYQLPRQGLFRRQVAPEIVVTRALRKLANGASWEDATRL